jgi:hypothetical protein
MQHLLPAVLGVTEMESAQDLSSKLTVNCLMYAFLMLLFAFA